MAVTLKDYLDRPLESYCSEILDEWRNLSRIDVPVLTTCMFSLRAAVGYCCMQQCCMHGALLLNAELELVWNGAGGDFRTAS